MSGPDLDLLASPFREKAYCLLAEIKRLGLPFVPFEGRRAFSRSAKLFQQGRTLISGVWKKTGSTVTNAHAGESPHNWGLAVDFVLDVKSPWFNGEDRPTGPWDDGFEKGKLVRPVVQLAWQKFGAAVESVGLTWGGRWTGLRDLPHAELPRWETLRPADWRGIVQREIDAGR
jgi:peptidoglycan L-alanyl-D-glutamate endopeptidase CwlK